MRVTLKFNSYNPHRYGPPWIHKIIEWPIGKKPSKVIWGGYIGDSYGGVVEVDAEPGDVIKTGQKDTRTGKSDISWWVVEENGSLSFVREYEAKDYFMLSQEEEAK